jgi:type I restriction enzyme S subunit
MSGWKECKLSSFMDFNPPTPLKKGIEHKKVGMEHLTSNGKKIRNWEISNFNGGTKFINGDTLVARITPCLENGKIGYVDMLRDDEVAFGSTEFIVLREKQGISDSQFIFYFAYWNEFRDLAIQLMTGSSGRQRVETDALKNKVFVFPPLPEQKAIAEVLSSLDDKIDILYRQNKTLEAMAAALFRQWFVEEMEDEWKIGTISQLVFIQNGFAFKSSDFKECGINGVIKIKNICEGIINIENTDFIEEYVMKKTDERFRIKTGDVLIAMTGAEIGKLGIIPSTDKSLWLNQRVGLLKEKFKGAKYLAYLCLKSELGQDHIENTATGSAQPNISTAGIENCEFPIMNHSFLEGYAMQIEELYNMIIFNLGQIRTLTQLRDTLLPRLMSGEVRVAG